MSFDTFWEQYPNPTKHKRRVGRVKAERIWKRMKLDNKSVQVVSNLLQWKKTDQWTQDDGKYIPMICTWLNRQPWMDADPAFEQEDLDRHKTLLSEESALALENPLVENIGNKVEDSEAVEANNLWWKVSSKDKNRIIKEYRDKHGYVPGIQIILWYYRENKDD